MYWYYIVLKKCKDLKDKPDEKYYRDIISNLLPSIYQNCITHEYDSKNILHCNLVFNLGYMLNYDDMYKHGCHINIQRIDNKESMFKIMKYIHKDYRLKLLPHQMLAYT